MSALFNTIRILSSFFLQSWHFAPIFGYFLNFFQIWPDCLNCLFELIWDVQLVSIKQQNDSIRPLSKPFEDPGKVITTVDQLLLSSQNTSSQIWEMKFSKKLYQSTWGVQQSHTAQSLGITLRCLKSWEKSSSKLLQMTEWFGWVHGKNIAWNVNQSDNLLLDLDKIFQSRYLVTF